MGTVTNKVQIQSNQSLLIILLKYKIKRYHLCNKLPAISSTQLVPQSYDCAAKLNCAFHFLKHFFSFVVTFRGVQDFLNHEHRVFNSEEFLRTREPADQLFYKKVRSRSQTDTEARWKPLVVSAACLSFLLSSPGIRHTHIPLFLARQAEQEVGCLQSHGAEHKRPRAQVWCHKARGSKCIPNEMRLVQQCNKSQVYFNELVAWTIFARVCKWLVDFSISVQWIWVN